jgi:drug/metabolite transporter (DMT)-like permease
MEAADTDRKTRIEERTGKIDRAWILTRLAIATAPALFVLLWSTGFIGARYGMPYIEPLTFLAVRMAFAVAIMAAIALASGTRWLHAERSATASLQAL